MKADEGFRGLDGLGMGGYVTDLLVMAEIVLASRGDRSNDVDGERLDWSAGSGHRQLLSATRLSLAVVLPSLFKAGPMERRLVQKSP